MQEKFLHLSLVKLDLEVQSVFKVNAIHQERTECRTASGTTVDNEQSVRADSTLSACILSATARGSASDKWKICFPSSLAMPPYWVAINGSSCLRSR